MTSTLAQKATLSGIITDSETGETLISATVLLKTDELLGTTTNVNGFFSLPGINPETFDVEFSFMGYKPFVTRIDFSQNAKQFVEIALKPSEIILEQINVIESGPESLGDKDVEISQHTLTPKAIRSIPTARNDVFRAIRYLPGVEATEPFSPLVSVRGSDPGENLIMLDGVTIYNPYHFISSSSIFNMQTVKNVDLMVGGFGAEYGGRNSSVINISTKDGNNSGVHGEVNPSTALSKVFLEFPVGEKSTMMVGARLYYDLQTNMMMYSNNYFYDTNLSFTHRFNAKNSLTFKYFSSKDKTDMDFNSFYKYLGNSMAGLLDDDEVDIADIFNDMSIKYVNEWKNNIATVIYKSVLGPRLYFKAQVYASLHSADNLSEMNFKSDSLIFFNTSTQFNTKVHDWCGKFNLNYKMFNWNNVNMGAEYNNYLFYNASTINKIENASAQKTPKLFSVYAEDKISVGSFTARAGIRATQFNKGSVLYEPRLNLVHRFAGNFKLEAAWGRYNQHVFSMNTQEYELNQILDYYYPLENGKPSQSEHFIVGAEKLINSNNTLSVDLYYKAISRTYTFDLMQDRFEAFALSDKIIAGTGKSYGVELMWKGSFGKLSGWGSYTLAKSTRSFPNIMNGEEFDYDYDRRHSIKAVLNYQITKRISYSSSFMAQSGVPKSIENTIQSFYTYEPLTGTMNYGSQYTVDKKNASRLPWVFYLDFGLQKRVVSGFGKNLADFFGADESYLIVNVNNVLFFRRNVLYYYALEGLDKFFPVSDSYFPTVSAGYTIKF